MGQPLHGRWKIAKGLVFIFWKRHSKYFLGREKDRYLLQTSKDRSDLLNGRVNWLEECDVLRFMYLLKSVMWIIKLFRGSYTYLKFFLINLLKVNYSLNKLHYFAVLYIHKYQIANGKRSLLLHTICNCQKIKPRF